MMWSVTKEMYPQSLAAAAWVPGMSAELGSGQKLPILLSHQSDYGLTNRHLLGFMSSRPVGLPHCTHDFGTAFEAWSAQTGPQVQAGSC